MESQEYPSQLSRLEIGLNSNEAVDLLAARTDGMGFNVIGHVLRLRAQDVAEMVGTGEGSEQLKPGEWIFMHPESESEAPEGEINVTYAIYRMNPTDTLILGNAPTSGPNIVGVRISGTQDSQVQIRFDAGFLLIEDVSINASTYYSSCQREPEIAIASSTDWAFA